MLNGFKVYDADAHALMTPGMWADLPLDLLFVGRVPCK